MGEARFVLSSKGNPDSASNHVSGMPRISRFSLQIKLTRSPPISSIVRIEHGVESDATIP